MLKNVIENYLTSIREVEFFGPFKSLLEGLGYFDIHLLHSPTEFGKDFIAKKVASDNTIQYCFQIKVGDINLNKFTNEIKPQLLEIITNPLSHPNFDKTIPLEIIFVTTGVLKPPATIAFQEFNDYVNKKLKTKSILTWEKDQIISDFYDIGIEPFFALHNSPEFIGRFFNLFSQIKNGDQITSFDITRYTDNWLSLDLSIKENKLQLWFEGYFFSKLLFENQNYYESVLFLAALCRVLIKNNLFDGNSEILLQSIKENINDFCSYFTESLKTKRETTLFGNSFFSLFTYPLTCLKTLELLSLYALLFKDFEKEKTDLFNSLLKEKGSYRIISDNYAISIFFITQFLLKQKRIDELKTYLNNCVVWICDRYEKNGISPIGCNLGEEYEQILSEYLTGLDYHQRKTSFMVTLILDICVYLNDPELYSEIANDFRAVEIIAEYYHIDSIETLFDYDKVITQTDYNFKLELQDNYSNYIKYRDENFRISLTDEKLYLLSILLRDRHFPQVFLTKA